MEVKCDPERVKIGTCHINNGNQRHPFTFYKFGCINNSNIIKSRVSQTYQEKHAKVKVYQMIVDEDKKTAYMND